MKNLKLLFSGASLVLLSLGSPAQGTVSNKQVLSTLRDPHVPATSVDALLPQLQALEKKEIISRDSQQVALDIFLQAAYAYARNFHFKQGLLVFQGYLAMKDKFYSLDKSAAVKGLLAQNEKRQEELNSELTKKKNAVDQLNLDIESWNKLNGKFSRNYSLVVILITAVLALIFIRININTVRAKNNLRDNRDKMMERQRLASLGRFYEGSLAYLKSSAKQILQKSADLSGLVKEKYSGAQNPISKNVPELLKQAEAVQRRLESLLG